MVGGWFGAFLALAMVVSPRCFTEDPSASERGSASEGTADSLRLEASFTGCLEAGPTRTRGGGVEGPLKEPTIEVLDRAIRYTRGATHNCCHEVEIRKVVKEHAMEIREIWSGQPCRCECASDLDVLLSPVPAGELSVSVLREILKADGSSAGVERILVREVVVP
jgi:hypothetical protein